MLHREEPDARLVALARRGDEAAFEAIVERYRPLLLGHSRRIAGDDAQDAVQQTFVSAWSALRRGCEVRDLRPWLFTIARRAALQALREKGERSQGLPESLAGGRSPVEHAEHSAQTRATFAAIADLPELERDALVWTSVHGRSGRDTAKALGVSEGAVRQLVFRARASVRAAACASVSPISVPRLFAWLGHSARRLPWLSQRALSGSGSPPTLGLLGKIAATAATGVLLGAPVAAFHFAHDHGATSPAHLIRNRAAALLTSTGIASRTGTRTPASRTSGPRRASSPNRKRGAVTTAALARGPNAERAGLSAVKSGAAATGAPRAPELNSASSGASGGNETLARAPQRRVIERVTADPQVPSGVAQQVPPVETQPGQLPDRRAQGIAETVEQAAEGVQEQLPVPPPANPVLR